MGISKRTAERIAKKQLALRTSLWPNLDEGRLWIRMGKVGFVTVPRGIPLVLRIMDELSTGKPPSSTYLDLWCLVRDECFVTITSPSERAFYAGFSGQRATITWQDRMRVLQKLGFIEAKPGPSGPFNYVLLWNPYLIIQDIWNRRNPTIPEESYNALRERLIQVGANDLSGGTNSNTATADNDDE